MPLPSHCLVLRTQLKPSVAASQRRGDLGCRVRKGGFRIKYVPQYLGLDNFGAGVLNALRQRLDLVCGEISSGRRLHQPHALHTSKSFLP